MTRSVLLVEDDTSLGLTLKERLQKEGFGVDLVGTLAEARQLLNRRFDLVILDVGLPDGSGLEFADEVRASSPVPFLFVTAQSDAESRLKGYEAGAEEFIPKPFHLKEFLMRVRHVLANHAASDRIVLSPTEFIDFDAFQVNVEDRAETLAQREGLVLKHLIESSPKVVSRDELLNLFWGEEKFPTQRTVDNVMSRLRTLLGAEHGARINSVRGVGYQWIKKEELS